jgi:metal-dependent amidase/aminoacylase/carboxypeptidase family protein
VDPVSRKLMTDELRRLAQSIGEAHGVTARVSIPEGTPPLVNPEAPTSWSREAVSRVLGDQALVPLGFLNLAGEDFAYYLERMPGCFLRIGAREAGGQTIPAHSSRFFPAEDSIFVGSAVLAECARVASSRMERR